ncbi:long-chain fatty acid transport protein 3 [Ambystoma mexicanum]|uniref:long-chain fatty acid transport protein 3 n=1 Tax=Ambystoma mexicanum TaxID=8296 RepID=UPI0037E85777
MFLWAFLAGLATLLLVQKIWWPYLLADFAFYVRLIRCQWKVNSFLRQGICCMVQRFTQRASAIPNKTFLIFEGDRFSYGLVESQSNRVANALLPQCKEKSPLAGQDESLDMLQSGDTIAILMSNEPAFLWTWFGLAKLGFVTAFLNINMRHSSLLHCCRTCGAKAIIVGADLFDAIKDVLPDLKDMGMKIWVMGKGPHSPGVTSLSEQMEESSDEPVPTHLSTPSNLLSTFIYIFTSGTTGLPKAARISHLKSMMCFAFYDLCGARSDDIIYLALPLYHMSASLLGIGGCIGLGATCVLKKKFSASQFWNDCRKYNVTVFQYIGELCRYLVNQPTSEEDTHHKVRLAAGSGLRPDVWKEFRQRFGKIRVLESYGMTEANVTFFNYTSKIGAIGRGGRVFRLFSPFELVKYDVLNEEAFRNEEGRCVRATRGETGLLISPVTARSPFLGYAGSKQLSEKKILKDVFKSGDKYFNTGDLMMQDQNDFVYFKDRTGDTYRWKGENVATTEVAELVGVLDFFQEVNVYGVSVPGNEGRVGMATVVLRPAHEFDGKRLYKHVVEFLPSYARPRFLRIQNALEMTGTFKQQKMLLVQESFNPTVIHEPLYFLDDSCKTYVPLDKPLYESIVSGEVRL